MKLKSIADNILKISSTYTKQQGTEIAKNSFVKDLKGKSIDDTYHIYGRVLNDNKSKTYSTHIKVNKDTDKIIDTKCTCETFDENRKQIRNYVCKHIVATSIVFYNVAKKKVKKEKPKEDIKKKRALKLDVQIKCIKNSGIPSYQCEFKIGVNGVSLITDLRDFLDKMEDKKVLEFNATFTYNPKEDKFSEEDMRIFNFLYKNKSKINGKYIKLHQNNIKEFLELIDEKKKIIFNYEAINYEVKIIKQNIPVALTIRCDKSNFILRGQKKVPTLLSNIGEVMLFDRNIYLPSENQVQSYIPIYKKLISNSEIRYPKTLESLGALLKELNNITNNVVLDENTKEYQSKLMRPVFYFYKYNGETYCNVKLNYSGHIIDLIKDSSDKSFLRDKMKEQLIDMELEKFKFIKKDRDFKFIGQEDDIFTLITLGFKRLREFGVVNLSKDISKITLVDSSKIQSELKEFNTYYTLNYEVDDFSRRELMSAIHSMKNGEKFYKKGNSYLDLSDAGVVEFLNLLDDLGIQNSQNNEISIEKNKALFLQEKLKNRNLQFIRGSEVFQEIVRKLLNKEYKRKLVPRNLNAKLRNYQVVGFKWLNEITELGFGGILADDMGLGKTIQIIAFILSQRKSKTIVITPTSLIYNWQDEFERFAPKLKIGIVHGSKSARHKVLDNYKKYDVLLTTYGTLKNDEDKYEDINFDYCIIDEAQNIKNPNIQATISVKKIKSRCNIALTGTPIENNLMELWSIFDFVMPGYLFTKERFKEKFLLKDNMEELKTLISPFILRRLKADVLDELPSKIEKKYLVEMNTKQKQIYASYVKEIKQQIELSKGNINLFAYLTKLRELCLDPSLVVNDYVGESAKLKVVNEIVNESVNSERKILIFSQFTTVLKKIEEKLSNDGIEHLYLDGATSAKERVSRVNKFNEDKDIKVFLISLKAGGVGLNLTSANVVIHFDPWWNPAIEDQATDRAHRLGQKNTVEVIKLIAKGTIEEKIISMQEDKKELIKSLMDNEVMDGAVLKRLTVDEIMKLFD